MSERIGVVGAGVMGAGIAQTMAAAGHPVVCVERDARVRDGVLETIEQGPFGLRGAVRRGKLTADEADAAVARISVRDGLDAVRTVSVVIEAVPEDLGLKTALFRELDRTVAAETVLASNSSGFPIVALAAATDRPELVVGWHWASPAPVMRLAEIVRGPRTADRTVSTVSELAAGAGKNPIVVTDQPMSWGYVANRVYAAMYREAERVVAEGVADAEEVDQLLMDCYRWPTGPFGMSRGARSGFAG